MTDVLTVIVRHASGRIVVTSRVFIGSTVRLVKGPERPVVGVPPASVSFYGRAARKGGRDAVA